MSWKESNRMNERLKFIVRLLEGESMTDLCKEFGVSRKTGYKFKERYESCGIDGVKDLSKIPLNHPLKTPYFVESLILNTKDEFKTWGAPKIKAYLQKKHPNQKIPAISTIHSILVNNNLVNHARKKNHFKSTGTHLSCPEKENDLWCADFKGQFKMKNNQYCYPLTITDQYSRYLIMIEALESTKQGSAFYAFERAFKEFGIPKIIRTDNGTPFASRSIWGLSQLSVWWLRLGIIFERITPGHPEQNGQHERMHRTLKAETTNPASLNLLHQQESFDVFKKIFNELRPHEGIEMKVPKDLYISSPKIYPGFLEEIDYENMDHIRNVSLCGSIIFRESKNSKRICIGQAFAGQPLGITKVDDELFEVYFMDYLLGFFDTVEYKFTQASNPFNFK